jgi:membrane-bound ClpP family serine protease
MNFSPTFWPALALVVLGLVLVLFAGHWIGLVLGIAAIVAGFVVLSRGRGRRTPPGSVR